MSLFSWPERNKTEAGAPLAARMRPRTLQDFVGQGHILAPGRLLRRAIEADQLSSVIFFGPPGTGKTTLARIIANTTQARFLSLNAVLAGIKDIREAIETARRVRAELDQRSILFIDEVHRFNKAQQDALLPWVENGTVILIGATTENPYFEVNKALVSRSRVFQLTPLEAEDLVQIAHLALRDVERGLGELAVTVDADALAHLVDVANGDARALLNALELAVTTTAPDAEDGLIRVTLAVAEESIQQRAVLYDKEGDVHFDTISAFIKSVRGSDPDAALYWLARMVHAGESPSFIFRRLLILAAEDVGLADPQAIAVVHACADTYDRIGLPEGRYHLAQATLYLATAPKSNSTMAFFDALAVVEKEQGHEIPAHLQDANRDGAALGHGAGYLYPHAYRDHWVAQQYLPRALQGRVFYKASDQGYEAGLREGVERRREAEVAAMDEGPNPIFTASPQDKQLDGWLQRTIDGGGQRAARVRDEVFAMAKAARHDVILDLDAASGLLTWEAIRAVPEGGVFAIAEAAHLESLRRVAERVPSLRRPHFVSAAPEGLLATLQQWSLPQRFDRIIGRNVLLRCGDKAALLGALLRLLAPEGRIVLAEAVARRGPRVYRWAEGLGGVAPELMAKWAAAEEAIYADPADPVVNWEPETLAEMARAHGLGVQLQTFEVATTLTLTQSLLTRWLTRAGEVPSYLDKLARVLTVEESDRVAQIVRQHFGGKTLPWATQIVILGASFASARGIS